MFMFTCISVLKSISLFVFLNEGILGSRGYGLPPAQGIVPISCEEIFKRIGAGAPMWGYKNSPSEGLWSMYLMGIMNYGYF